MLHTIQCRKTRSAVKGAVRPRWGSYGILPGWHRAEKQQARRSKTMKETYPFPKKPLPYDFDALEPYIDRETMEYHHDKHLGTYTDKLNQALSGYPDYQGWTLEELLCNLEKLPEELRTPVIHNGGGVYNHWMYFSSLGREKKLMGETALKKVAESFGSLEQMKAKMKELALGVFGSGYVWLAVKDGTLVLEQTANQDTPLSLGMIPILPLDVWEHAYYLKHQNRRADYLEQYMSAVDWGIVGERIEEAVKW